MELCPVHTSKNMKPKVLREKGNLPVMARMLSIMEEGEESGGGLVLTRVKVVWGGI